jgi:restriction endonuclease Mrr
MTNQFPSNESLLLAMIEILKNENDSLHVNEIELRIIKYFNIDSESASKVRNGNRTELGYRLAWARSKGKAMGVLISPKHSHWAASRN